MTRHNHKRGFSLIEAAIVLAVVGAVIGGIWVAASAITTNRRIEEASQGILRVVTEAQNIFKGLPANFNHNGDLLYKIGAVPSDWINGDGCLQTPDMKIGFCIWIYDTTIGLQFDHYGITYSDCVRLLPKIIISSDAQEVHGSMGTYTKGNGKFPMSTAHIQEACEYVSNYLEVLYRR